MPVRRPVPPRQSLPTWSLHACIVLRKIFQRQDFSLNAARSSLMLQVTER
jgi:hypothetical protein